HHAPVIVFIAYWTCFTFSCCGMFRMLSVPLAYSMICQPKLLRYCCADVAIALRMTEVSETRFAAARSVESISDMPTTPSTVMMRRSPEIREKHRVPIGRPILYFPTSAKVEAVDGSVP